MVCADCTATLKFVEFESVQVKTVNHVTTKTARANCIARFVCCACGKIVERNVC